MNGCGCASNGFGLDVPKQKTSGTVLIVVGVLGLGLALYIASKSKGW